MSNGKFRIANEGVLQFRDVMSPFAIRHSPFVKGADRASRAGNTGSFLMVTRGAEPVSWSTDARGFQKHGGVTDMTLVELRGGSMALSAALPLGMAAANANKTRGAVAAQALIPHERRVGNSRRGTYPSTPAAVGLG